MESTKSNVSKTSSMDYADRVRACSHQSWADQLDKRAQEASSQTSVPHDHNKAYPPNSVPQDNGINYLATPPDLEPSVIPYQANQPADLQLWDRNFSLIFLFGTDEFLDGDAKNIACSLQRIATFIKQRPLGDKDGQDIPQISGFGFAAWDLIFSIYNSGWDKLLVDDKSRTFRQCVASQFNRKDIPSTKVNNKTNLANISRIPPPIPPRPSASVLAKIKHHKNTRSFAQATKGNAEDILKIKEAFSKLSTKKIIEMHNIAHNTNQKSCLKLNMTTKGPSRKQIIIPMSQDNSNIIITCADEYIFNINRLFKSIKSNVTADFLRSDNRGIIVTTNQIASSSDMSIIEKYIKESNNINPNDILPPCLPQSKSYLKILGIPYITNNSTPISHNQVEEAIKRIHLFNDIVLASCSCVIKASPKSDMVVIWIDIWDSQNSTKAKSLVNRCFNIGQHIVTIHGTNMNPGIP